MREDALLKGSLAEHAPGDIIETFTILATAANAAVVPVHDRMAVIVPPERFAPWLAGEDVALDPYAPKSITVRPVSTYVNKPTHDVALHRARRTGVRPRNTRGD